MPETSRAWVAESAAQCAAWAEAEPAQKQDRLVSVPPKGWRPRLELKQERKAKEWTPQGAAKSRAPERAEVTSTVPVLEEQTATGSWVPIRDEAAVARSPQSDAVPKPEPLQKRVRWLRPSQQLPHLFRDQRPVWT